MFVTENPSFSATFSVWVYMKSFSVSLRYRYRYDIDILVGCRLIEYRMLRFSRERTGWIPQPSASYSHSIPSFIYTSLYSFFFILFYFKPSSSSSRAFPATLPAELHLPGAPGALCYCEKVAVRSSAVEFKYGLSISEDVIGIEKMIEYSKIFFSTLELKIL